MFAEHKAYIAAFARHIAAFAKHITAFAKYITAFLTVSLLYIHTLDSR